MIVRNTSPQRLGLDCPMDVPSIAKPRFNSSKRNNAAGRLDCSNQAHRLAAINDNVVSPSIPCLLLLRCPVTIFGAIVSVIVAALNGVSLAQAWPNQFVPQTSARLTGATSKTRSMGCAGVAAIASANPLGVFRRLVFGPGQDNESAKALSGYVHFRHTVGSMFRFTQHNVPAMGTKGGSFAFHQ